MVLSTDWPSRDAAPRVTPIRRPGCEWKITEIWTRLATTRAGPSDNVVVDGWRSVNPEIANARGFGERWGRVWQEAEAEADVALLRAFPVIAERVDTETKGFDYDRLGETPYDMWRHSRTVIHMLQRLAFQEGEDWLVEILEQGREQVAAQTAFALAEFNQHHEANSES